MGRNENVDPKLLKPLYPGDLVKKLLIFKGKNVPKEVYEILEYSANKEGGKFKNQLKIYSIIRSILQL